MTFKIIGRVLFTGNSKYLLKTQGTHKTEKGSGPDIVLNYRALNIVSDNQD